MKLFMRSGKTRPLQLGNRKEALKTFSSVNEEYMIQMKPMIIGRLWFVIFTDATAILHYYMALNSGKEASTRA
ncbi:hypothetical protein ACMD2_04753 [Ananas comosus]|uniref:Uncharacterized protein n=1 Tax=Ananas comosus TaxID=4615 RepID=A0A199W3V0_ANACO|nr:hypothetical protein ACMD2_04753 [Ananas comosus]